MAVVVDTRKRAAEEKKVRIDHSDVYLENEKLAEALDVNLDLLSRRRHRQVINRDHEIRLLRKTLSAMNVTKTSTPAATSVHTSSPTPSQRRLKPPPTFIKLDVHVPHQSHNGKDSDNSDNDRDFDDSTDDEDERKKWWKLRRARSKVAWGETRDKDGGTANHRTGSAKHDVKKVTREQLMLNNLDMNMIPQSWYTEVHQPAEVTNIRRRASSAHPSTRPTLPASSSSSSSSPSSSSTPIRRPKSETCKLRPRRVKSAFPITSITTTKTTSIYDEDDRNDSVLVCGGTQQQKKTETTRSRRQLMEQMGAVRRQAEPSEATDSNRLKFLMALHRERERLDGRVKRFLQSCDEVGEGGISSKKTKEYQTFFLPETLT